MSRSLFPKLAWTNLGKNRAIYFPYIFMSIFITMMYYMMNSIIHNEDVNNMSHADNILALLNIGLWVVRIFVVIFLFYINSFLIKRRKKELGLFHVLGMEKRHICAVQCWETGMVSMISITAGLILGIVLNKLLFLLLYKLLAVDALPSFEVSGIAVVKTFAFMFGLFILVFLMNTVKVYRTNPIELLHGGEIGEREPKTKILMTLVGVICIGAGYSFALYAKSPLQAITYFFAAVVLVMIGTYALFTAGSIAVLKLLKNNKRFYYQTSHFTNVSGMLYRMKQNAVGLASICILSTMVLITVATTVSLYFGLEDIIVSTYPNEINITNILTSTADNDRVEEQIALVNQENGVEISEYSSLVCLQADFSETERGQFEFINDYDSMYTKKNVVTLMALDVEQFNQIHDTSYHLAENEVMSYYKDENTTGKITFAREDIKAEFQVVKSLKRKEISKKLGIQGVEVMAPCYLLVVKDLNVIDQLREKFYNEKDINEIKIYDLIQFDTNCKEKDSIALTEQIGNIQLDGISITADNQMEIRKELHSMYGSFLFLGIFFGFLFLVATTLIIYYKQISEGYEDRERFVIMQKVGMSLLEVKKSIRSQILMVFFLPLLTAGIHEIVSYRIIEMILKILALGNESLFKICSIATFIAFAILYGVVYRITARAYYKIVSTSMK